jgi:hypothetical protein
VEKDSAMGAVSRRQEVVMIKGFILCCVLALAAPACTHYSVLTPAQVSERGTHRYGNASREKVVDACAAALATLGYKVTVKQPDSGVVKTAPASVMTSATGGPGYANVTEDGLAWSLVVETSGTDVVVHATPRGFRNGSELHDENLWVAEVMDAKFRDLWHEIDGTLGVQKSPKS